MTSATITGTPASLPASVSTPPGSDVQGSHSQPSGEGFLILDDEWYYKIPEYNHLPPFFINLVSADDHWFFISTTGGLTCGRESSDHALFPYEPEDKIRDSHTHTGPVTWLRLRHRGEPVLWQPFSPEPIPSFNITRHLYKNACGNLLLFEETNHDLDLVFRYRWATSGNYGFVRTATLESRSGSALTVEILDGLRNLLPPGVDRRRQQEYSCLTQAYKYAEPLGGSLAVYAMSSGITDQAAPMESLLATTAWSAGLPSPTIDLHESAVADFLAGLPSEPPHRLRGRPGSYLLRSTAKLPSQGSLTWHQILDVRRTQTQVATLDQALHAAPEKLLQNLEKDIEEGTRRLRRLTATADGLQATGNRLVSHHHFTNTLFNLMRGGVFSHPDQIDTPDFLCFLRSANRTLADQESAFLNSLPTRLPRASLQKRLRTRNLPALDRLFLEYLPLTFSRRHGDPSRPWNHFSIRIADEESRPVLDYQGNWRDIFQNWEALALSHPDWLPHMILRFVNASTADGYNPYRLMRSGFEWEEPNPEDPWSGIGYWGDHQIIYLLKLLEWARAFDPDGLGELLHRPLCTYAEVPYEIASYDSLCIHPRDTITYNKERNRLIQERFRATGSDGKLLQGADGPLQVTLAEKLLVPVLAKLSNFIPGGGIWMNTQRPEWNDANNALVGYGVSVVTLCYLRRHLVFLAELFEPLRGQTIPVSREVGAFMGSLLAILAPSSTLQACSDSRARSALCRQLGEAGALYRAQIYRSGLSAPEPLPVEQILALFHAALPLLEVTLQLNRRDDGLYHSYNLLAFSGEGLELHRLDLMLEGQVAVLSAAWLEAEEAISLLDRLRHSPLYRPDQDTYLLYPDKELPGFMQKNRIDPGPGDASLPGLLRNMLAAGDTRIVSRDVTGTVRFHPGCTNASTLAARLDDLASDPVHGPCTNQDREQVLALYESVFHHHAFTGRSGTMFAYEGLGSIYWHMVAKLLLAVQENHRWAVSVGTPVPLQDKLAEHYRAVRSGLGFNKNSRSYGAFPVDPYSHTPAHAGAQQPGMTGLVKEEILARFGELGVEIHGGRLHLHPRLLDGNEVFRDKARFNFLNVWQEEESLELPPGSLAFTFCQVPVCYRKDLPAGFLVAHLRDGSRATFEDGALDTKTSRAIFSRNGSVRLLEAGLPS
jgi:hypothetical protein